MPKTILGLQVCPTEAIAVHLRGGWKGAVVDAVLRFDLAEGDPWPASGLPVADAVVSALPADGAFSRRVTLPFADRAKAQRAAPLEAEESLPLPLEELSCHAHLLGREGGSTTALLAAAPEARVEGLVETLGAAGIRMHALDLEPLALVAVLRKARPAAPPCWIIDLSPRLCQAVTVAPGGPWAFHAFSGASDDPAFFGEVALWVARRDPAVPTAELAYLSGPDAASQDLAAWSAVLGVPVEVLPLPAENLTVRSPPALPWPAWAIPLGLALREGYAKGASQVNLLQGRFAQAGDVGPWKRRAVTAGGYLAALAALWGAGVWAEVAHRNHQYEVLRASVREGFQRALPEVTTIVSEVDQMRARVEEFEGRAASLGSLVDRDLSPLNLLREFSARVPREIEVEFRDFTVEEGRVRVEGITTSFDAIDRIKADLAQYPRFASATVSDAKAGVERDKVLFKLAINLGKEK